MIVRAASAADIPAIRAVVLECFGDRIRASHFYDERLLERLTQSAAAHLIVAEDPAVGRIVGVASVDVEVGPGTGDVGEFGRLAVHPAFRRRGIATMLMRERLRLVDGRLRVAQVTVRLEGMSSLHIALAHGFRTVGFLPCFIDDHESLVLLVRHFGGPGAARRPRPRPVARVRPLCEIALRNCLLPCDAIEDHSAAYPDTGTLTVSEVSAAEYVAFARTGVAATRRDLFDTARLHYGVSRLPEVHTRYLVARTRRGATGAAAFSLEPWTRKARLLELITAGDEPVRPLFAAIVGRWPEYYVRADASAHAPRIQQTLCELGFVPVAYVPALGIDRNARIDVVKMARIGMTVPVAAADVPPEIRDVAGVVLDGNAERIGGEGRVARVGSDALSTA